VAVAAAANVEAAVEEAAVADPTGAATVAAG
jgi:hypothetical protein